MLSKDERLILQMFVSTNKPLTSDEVAYTLSLSSKTIRKKINELNVILSNHGASISMRKGVGYYLEISDDELFSRFKYESTLVSDVEGLSKSKNELADLIVALLSQADYIKADDLAELIFVSKSKLTQLLNEVRAILSQYDLKLVVKPHYGIKIEGDEFNYRRFISSNYAQNISLFLAEVSDKDVESISKLVQFDDIKQIVETALKEFNYSMTFNVINSLVIHLVITMLRVDKGLSINSRSSVFIPDDYKEEKIISNKIIQEIENRYHISFPKQEVEYIMLHLVSKRVLEEHDSQRIPNEINILIERILERIKEVCNIDLLDDFDLRLMLGLHLVPLTYRLQYGMEIKNPILNEVKSKCIAAYDLAIVCANCINQQYHVTLSDHEISYFALHFDVALNRENNKIKAKKVLVVCASGRASAQLLKVKFINLFSKYIDTIDVCDVLEVRNFISCQDYDFIFTTVPLSIDLLIPVFEFQFFLNEESIKKIDSVLNSKITADEIRKYFKPTLFLGVHDFQTKEDALNYMLKEVVKRENLPNEFIDSVWERENFCGTDLMPNTALPHPHKTMSDETLISVMILRKPILWNNNKIRLILLVSIARNDSEKYAFIYEWIIGLLSDTNAMKHVLENGDYETLMYEVLALNINKGV